ncbi:Predicted transcriptional regulator YheO, contains PAS and DNA-binding HTH domains [Clostridium cavendishii DSM 21758]|uniref:Predicted transcriptional regulator YheO, contains PAS and DNA-binding HTH domains n=1 Tax=Clostridium cavendishii DSM 21758 TaxID=1121302 RepID=A0A1M6DL87_9CLOT|nr:helix-turn-helix transcriptional regulator [Clostridium cavendishii]SHI74016.1 Predicted transcriptional regulator YheO, contains PAS and DNA-binding HTH domains [Clostridium cavendishii DSM 21758]
MSVYDDFDFLKRLIKGIAEQFGPNCEVTIHDLKAGYEHSIIAIENGHVTGRKVGDVASRIAMETIHSNLEHKDHYSYSTRTSDGRILKSTTICIPDENGEVKALLCINYDITQLIISNNIMQDFVSIKEEKTDGDDVAIPTDVNQLLEDLIKESYELVGKPVAVMTKDDKMKAIKYLESKGALLIKKSGDKISKFYDISKYSLYSYLNSDEE